MKIPLIFCLGAVAHLGCSAEPVRLSIPEVLNPATRVAAFHRFCQASAKDATKQAEFAGFKAFALEHQGLNVTVSPDAPGGPRYLLTWQEEKLDLDENWALQEGTPESLPPALEPKAAGVLLPGDVKYQLFNSLGDPVTDDIWTARGSVVIDVDGDGSPEEIEVHTSSVGSLVPPSSESLVELEYLSVCKAGDPLAKSSLAILYNVHPQGRDLESTWGFQVRPGHDGEDCALELGPYSRRGGVEPVAVFRWDKAKGAWQGPEPKPGDHFLVITGQDPDGVAQSGALSLPLRAPLAELPTKADDRRRPPDEEDVPKEKASKPYRKRSLARLSNEEILTYMGQRRSISDYPRGDATPPSAVPNLWTLDPAEAALAYVRANRPPPLESRYIYEFAMADGETAPEEGDFTLSDGPSGCLSPGGAYVHHLHCAPEGSFLTYVKTVVPYFGVPFITSLERAEVRKLDLSHEQARRLWQTLWWMSRLRTRPLGYSDSGGSGATSTSDGQATVQIVARREKVVITGTRTDPYLEQFHDVSFGMSAFSNAFSVSAFINLSVRLFDREVPSWLGAAWTSQAVPDRLEDWEAKRAQPPEDLVATRRRVGAVLQLAIDHKVTPDVASPAVGMVGSHGWQELRPLVETLQTQLAPPFAWENRIAELDQEIAVWREKFGEPASEAAYYQRISGPRVLTAPDLSIIIPAEPEKFYVLDSLYRERSDLSLGAPHAEQKAAELRTMISYVLRQLETFDDPAALVRWAREQGGGAGFTLHRLAILDPRRALEVLDQLALRVTREYDAEQVARDRAQLKGETEVAKAPLAAEKRTALLALLRSKETPDTERSHALSALLPASDPARYRDAGIDAALLDFLRDAAGHGFSSSRDFATAAAVRVGGQAWGALVDDPVRAPARFNFFPDNLPALSLLAERQPRRYRAKVRRLIAPELVETRGDLDALLFAVWRLDLREFRPVLQHIATSGPADYEGILVPTRLRPVDDQRYHRARHILAMWDEPDPLTRARLQIAFAAASARAFASKPDGSLAFLCRSFGRASGLTNEQRKALAGFAEWCEQNAQRRYASEPAQVAAVMHEVRAAVLAKGEGK